MTTKPEQRRSIKTALFKLSTAECESLSRAASHRLCELAAFKDAKLILAYRAMPHECDPIEVVAAARKQDKRVAFPLCCENNTLRLLVPESSDAFVIGSYGILEPDITRSTQVSPDEIDLAIVPGLGFDELCHRLGRGAGYYDRLLYGTSMIKVGFAFDEQIIAQVMTDPHDIPLDCVVTPTRLLRPN